MQVVGGGEDDSIEVRAGEEVAIVDVGSGAICGGGLAGAVAVEVADGDQVGAGVFSEGLEVLLAHALEADDGAA